MVKCPWCRIYENIRKLIWRKQRDRFLIDFMNVSAANPGKTIKISKDGVEALETTEPDYVIIGEISYG